MPRGGTLEEIISRFPPGPATKERKLRERQERKLILDSQSTGPWFKSFTYLISTHTERELEDKENRMPPVRECLVQVTREGILVVDAKTLNKMYGWELGHLKQWKMPNPKTLIAYFGNRANEAVVFKSSDVKHMVSLISSYTTNTPVPYLIKQ